ncbi:hypothetical protein [Sutcliffiella rhizosphaerae]|uniref:hypothetical protein n=1 Tax=Sutcliffiella rhizosphaerae TaxID=2880967 RepID=UPI001E2826A0|nr:hypothetical protein [Sutcliffiella rhizosphaerae]
MKNNFKFAIFIEFLVGTFTFGIVAELFLVPVATLLLIFYSISKTNKSHKSAEKLFTFLLTTVGLLIVFYASRNAVQSYPDLNILELSVIFSIPITMTLLFLPLSYIFALYSEYERLFIRLKLRLPMKKLSKKMKWKILRTCKFSLKKVKYFNVNYLMKFYSSMKLEDISLIIDSFSLSYRNHLNPFKKMVKK